MLSRTSHCRIAAGRIAALVLLLLLPVASPAQDRTQRLILKDGSYQPVTKYEVKGDRVRYLSAERNEWEELPANLVDWPATEKYEKDRAAGASAPNAIELDKELETERELDQAGLPQVAPGLRLPEPSGVFLLDNYKGEPQLVEMQQSAGDLNRNTKANIFRGAINPVAGAKQTIEIEGEHAAVKSHAEVPSIYISVEDLEPERSGDRIGSGRAASKQSRRDEPEQPEQPQQPEQPIVPFDRFRIVRAQVKGGKRIVGDVKRAITGKVSQEQRFVNTTTTRLSGGWLKITPTESLAPGEYALVETMGQEGINLYLWDFGVNPNAPPNANPWRPDAPATASKPDAKPR
jgi:hypothetical protein